MFKILLLLLQLQGAMPGFTPRTYTVLLKLGDSPALVQLDMVLVAPQFLAIANRDKGQEAFDQCMQTAASGLACESQRAAAIAEDAKDRFIFAFLRIMAGVAWDQALRDSQLFLLPVTEVNVLPLIKPPTTSRPQ